MTYFLICPTSFACVTVHVQPLLRTSSLYNLGTVGPESSHSTRTRRHLVRIGKIQEVRPMTESNSYYLTQLLLH